MYHCIITIDYVRLYSICCFIFTTKAWQGSKQAYQIILCHGAESFLRS